MYLQPYTFYLIISLITLLLAITFGFLVGTIVAQRRFAQSKQKPTVFRI